MTREIGTRSPPHVADLPCPLPAEGTTSATGARLNLICAESDWSWWRRQSTNIDYPAVGRSGVAESAIPLPSDSVGRHARTRPRRGELPASHIDQAYLTLHREFRRAREIQMLACLEEVTHLDEFHCISPVEISARILACFAKGWGYGSIEKE